MYFHFERRKIHLDVEVVGTSHGRIYRKVGAKPGNDHKSFLMTLKNHSAKKIVSFVTIINLLVYRR